MRLRSLAPCVLALSIAAACQADAAGADPRHTYVLRLADAPLVEHAAARAEQQGLVATLGRRAALRTVLSSDDSAGYLAHLDAAREAVLAAGGKALGRTLPPRHAYRYASNGVALELTDAEARQLASLPGVAGVHRERIEHVLTDAGPQWIGADKLWNGQVAGAAKTKGEGVVIGIVDTGINPTHPSFAATGGDGYTHTNPRGHFYGKCADGTLSSCNAKLIGIYDMTDEGTNGIDSAGHGSHVSGIAAGNAITDALQGNTVSLPRNVSGVAPHANIIMYKACKVDTSGQSGGSCGESDLIAALDQATADGVDVINYSIGGDAQDPFQLLAENSDAAAMFNARNAGIVVVVAAGNEGPGAHSITEPANAPWVLAVANASHNRRFANSVGDFSGVAGAPGTLQGLGYTAGYGPADIVYAGDFGNALCGKGATEGTSPTGASNPFAPGTFHGQIVVCDRGTYARVEKGYNVKAAGAGGYILANAPSDGESVISDDHYLPAVHLGYSEGVALKGWLTVAGSHQGKIAGVSAVLDASYGDILDASSGRGPFGFAGGVLKPDITAPGDNILSAAMTGTGEALLSGTSMASPHVAGAAALIVAAHPDWSPAQIESALLGTALAGSVRKEDAVTPATPLDAGAGRAQPAAAAIAGLYLPLSASDIRAQDPTHGGDPRKLNRTGIEAENCVGQCSFARTVTDMSGGGTWQVTTSGTPNAKITVTPSQFTLAPGASQALAIAVDVSDPTLPGTWVNGRIVLHKSTGGQSAADTALTLAVYSSPGTTPDFQTISTAAPTGSATFTVSGLAALPKATFSNTNLAVPTTQSLTIQGSTSSTVILDPYANPSGSGEQFVLVPIAGPQFTSAPGFGAPTAQARLLIVELTMGATTNEVVLYAGIDGNGDGKPNSFEQACETAAVRAGTARCIVDLAHAPAGAANAWVLIAAQQGLSGPSTVSATLATAVPSIYSASPGADNSGGRIVVTGPGHVQASDSFPVRIDWGPVENGSQDLVTPGTYYGAVLIDGASGHTGQYGFVPFSFTRAAGGDDVADALETSGARTYVLESGESLQHVFFDVPANGTLDLTTGTDGKSNVAAYVARADFPTYAASPQVAAAPPVAAAASQWTLDAQTTAKHVSVPVTPGRWYVAAQNTGTAEVVLSVLPQFTQTTALAPPTPGAYYNPERSGHGVFMSQAGGQQAVYWYTYLEDGTPIWYGSQAAVPTSAASTWTAPLFRVTWDGAEINSYTVVGDVIVTPVNATDFIYSWHLGGSAGSERFAMLGTNTCVPFGGSQADFTGMWYAPAQPGHGMDVLAMSGLQFDAYYFYDDLGRPRWAAGSTSNFSAHTVQTMNQIAGFCPSCAYTPTVPSPIGTLTVDYASATQGTYVADLHLLPPLSGTWTTNQPIARLTGSPACPR